MLEVQAQTLFINVQMALSIELATGLRDVAQNNVEVKILKVLLRLLNMSPRYSSSAIEFYVNRGSSVTSLYTINGVLI